jgi:hypothetical protein
MPLQGPPVVISTELQPQIIEPQILEAAAAEEIEVPELKDVDPESLVEAPRELFGIEQRQVFHEILYRFFELEYRFSEASYSSNLLEIETDSLAAAKNGWMLLVSRLLTRSKEGEEMEEGTLGQNKRSKDILVSFILEDFKERIELALLWLHEEYYREYNLAEPSPTDNYFIWFHKLLYGLQQPKENGELVLDPKDRAFTKFLLEAPDLSDESIHGVLKSYCDQEEKMPLGISTLRDLILYRPAVREECLEILFALCLHHGILNLFIVRQRNPGQCHFHFAEILSRTCGIRSQI